MEDYNVMICPVCERKVDKLDMMMTRDCHGIPFRYVCEDCWYKIMDEKGYDGEYYTELDENLEVDY